MVPKETPEISKKEVTVDTSKNENGILDKTTSEQELLLEKKMLTEERLAIIDK